MPETPEIPEVLPLVDVAAADGATTLPEGEAAACQEICGGTPTSQKRDPFGRLRASVGDSALVPETAKENETMLDVHMPHESHTWKGFWIHLGTITIGLLIAISLEQGVEKLTWSRITGFEAGSISCAPPRRRL